MVIFGIGYQDLVRERFGDQGGIYGVCINRVYFIIFLQFYQSFWFCLFIQQYCKVYFVKYSWEQYLGSDKGGMGFFCRQGVEGERVNQEGWWEGRGCFQVRCLLWGMIIMGIWVLFGGSLGCRRIVLKLRLVVGRGQQLVGLVLLFRGFFFKVLVVVVRLGLIFGIEIWLRQFIL